MSALSKARDTVRMGEAAIVEFVSHPVAATTKIFNGSLVALDASGNAVPASTSTSLTAVGRAESTVDNSGGSAGDQVVRVRQGTFRFANSADADAITQAEVGKPCYLVDDQTVAKTTDEASRSGAGVVVAIDPKGVYVEVRASNGPIFDLLKRVVALEE